MNNLHEYGAMSYGDMVMLFVVIGVYLLPAIIAAARGHKKEWWITPLNLFLGWTGIIWIVCFIWSSTGENERKRRWNKRRSHTA